MSPMKNIRLSEKKGLNANPPISKRILPPIRNKVILPDIVSVAQAIPPNMIKNITINQIIPLTITATYKYYCCNCISISKLFILFRIKFIISQYILMDNIYSYG